MKSFERYLQEHGHTSLTIKGYLYEIGIFLMTNPKSKKYKYKDIINYLNDRAKNYPKSYTAIRSLASIKKYFDFLIEEGKIEYHPCRTLYLKPGKGHDVIHQDLFSSEELELLINREERYKNIELKNRTIISLLIYQGLTGGEITRIKVQHVNLDSGILYIKASKLLAARHLDIMPNQLELLYRCVNEMERKGMDNLIIGRSGKPINQDDVHHIVYTCKSFFSDRNLNPKTIRQSVIANWLNEKKMPLEQVQLMAGHKWISSTERYRQANPDEQSRLINMWHPLG